ncbi:DNA packaging protein UL33 [Saimiriine alphaherpesvirus 1]|uniref:DNA packaging protein UL33 n=1 Tax=Saimiriine herpesvirus 1 (strain MV-5-4-PSL) TaxID=10353 RepID=E2IUD6_SHV1|nr:DNA packaging protein UL33 [Saimiriine alphaherpesvirus 1]ADO13794.1 DNA packaging protein UL33 [Saimiriine alphaherpesvirus 1]
MSGAAEARRTHADCSEGSRARRARPTGSLLVPSEELAGDALDELEARYAERIANEGVWFEDLTPTELDVVFPTTDGKLNYLSRTRRLASLLTYGDGIKPSDGPPERQTDSGAACVHAELLARKRERFAAVINRFLDLHQILRS